MTINQGNLVILYVIPLYPQSDEFVITHSLTCHHKWKKLIMYVKLDLKNVSKRKMITNS